MSPYNEGLREALSAWRRSGRLWTHVPAHRGGAGAPKGLRTLLDLSWDATELPGLDDLAEPAGALAVSQARAAAVFGAEESYFLVGGVTAGVQAAVLAAVGPGETILVPRTAHRSLAAALILTGARPRFIVPETEPEFGLPLGVALKHWEAGLEGVAAAFWVDPTYHGVATDVRTLAEAAHARGLPLIVDAAHGATFGQDPALPASALSQGADVVVLGLHKSGGSPTQTALLLVQGDRIDRRRLRESLNLIQTSSPSYLLLLGLDLTVRWWEGEANRSLRRSLTTAALLRARSPWPLFQPPVGSRGVVGWDPTRLTLRVAAGAWEGSAALTRFRELGVEPEYADLENVLFCLGLGTGRGEGEILLRAWEALGYLGPAPAVNRRPPEGMPIPALTPREAHFSRWERLPLPAARDRVAAQSLVPYPPGSPVVYPGEVLTEPWIEYLMELRRRGREVRGLGPEETIRVVAGSGERSFHLPGGGG